MGCWSYLGELTIYAVSELLIVEGAMLSNSRSVWAAWGQNLVPPVDVVLLYQLLFVFVEILGIGYAFLKGLISEAGEEVFLQIGGGTRGWPVVQVLKLRVTDELVCAGILEHS